MIYIFKYRTKEMKKLIINADDFGINKEVNCAIMTAMELNICTDSTLLVNFENSEDASKLAIANNKKDNIGIHLNLTEGYPLTTKIRNESRFCNSDGLFHFKKNKRIIYLSRSEKKAVYEELTSQIQLCRKMGIPITHADSHNHIHEEPGLLILILNILKKENISFLRITNNMGETSFQNRMYRNSYNQILRIFKFAGTDYFGSAYNLSNFRKPIQENSIIELMIHPGLVRDNQIFDVYSKENLSQLLPEIIENYKLLAYNQLKK
jgi:predicted glycoside hydrolase/deacetylase ChbG (UPF0249 family)